MQGRLRKPEGILLQREVFNVSEKYFSSGRHVRTLPQSLEEMPSGQALMAEQGVGKAVPGLLWVDSQLSEMASQLSEMACWC